MELTHKRFVEWTSLPKDWSEVKEIRITISPRRIMVIYVSEGSMEMEAFPYTKAIQGTDGMIKLMNTPFSLLKFASHNRIIISRMETTIKRAYAYIFETPAGLFHPAGSLFKVHET